MDEIKLNDIADELLILNKTTIDTLFELENCADCIALYIFYYKTAKWQKTNTIKANDTYVKKSLKWGNTKILNTKNTLKEHGLINIIQRRKDNKIDGWYIEVSYLVSKKKIEDIKIVVDHDKATTLESNNFQKQQLPKATSSFQDTNALKQYNKCLKTENKMLKNNKINKVSKKENKKSFDEIIDNYTLDEELRFELKNHLSTRKSKKATLTNRAIELSLKKLDDLTKNVALNELDKTKIKIVQQSIEHGWIGFFALQQYNNYNNNNYSNKKQSGNPFFDLLREEGKM